MSAETASEGTTRPGTFAGWAAKSVTLLLLALSACAAPRPASRPAAEPPPPLRTNENLHAVLWTQTSVEYRASAEQAYTGAAVMLDRALRDTSWTAALEQLAREDYGTLPPAVVLDVDETVLDNAAYQARLVLEDAEYDRESWAAWVEERKALPVPGALAFTRYADRLGVAVLYLTNRRQEEEAATRDNLLRYGFPVSDAYDAILTRGERPAWDTSDKTSRRRDLAGRFRILLLVGDNLGDFLPDVERPLLEREQLAHPYTDFWGTRWILLPNPQYGSWEGAFFDFDYSLSREERLRRKYEALNPDR